MADLITPGIPKGTRDFLPKDMAKRHLVMETIKSTFVSFGYDAVETPALEHAETLLGRYGKEDSKLTYRFKDKGGRQLALRYDQTVPFARFVATHHRNLPMPFKRYQISPVWRADRPGKGRYREFYQCDVDIIGTRSLLAEAEIAMVTNKVFESLGFDGFVITFNSRRLINSILTRMGIPSNRQTQIIRVIDKLGRMEQMKVAEELRPLLGEEATYTVLDIIAVRGTNAQKIALLEPYDVREIQDFLTICDAFEIPSERLVFDVSLARGLDYYTGVVFEVFSSGIS